MKIKKILSSVTRGEYFMFSVFLLFSMALMWKTFRIDSQGNLQIASKAWSDFAATIPLIRSFSFGINFPPQYPIFPGPPIRYHFIFFALVGFLEKAGLRLDLVLNSLSTLFFFSFLMLIYSFGKIIFKRRGVGIISVILFLFNGSFGFLEFFKKHPLSEITLTKIIDNTDFSSFGPYDGKIVSAFWNLNIFTNQRHLSLAYASFLALVLIIYRYSKNPGKLTYLKALVLGIALGISPFIHLSVFIMSGMSLLIFLLVYPGLRRKVFVIGIVALVLAVPQFLYMGKSQIETSLFHPGYLVGVLTLENFAKYWFLNLGLTVILAPIGFFLAQKDQRKIALPFILFFVVGNLFQFMPDMPTNHKFFNLFVIGTNFFTSYFLVKIWQKRIIGKVATIGLLLPLTLTGFIDLFPILNDRYITMEDIPNNKAATFIKESTPKDAVFLNTSFLYDPASIAGRKVYSGWPYFSWGAGYDTYKRGSLMRSMLSPSDIHTACSLFQEENIDFIEIQIPGNILDTPVNKSFFDENFRKIYYDPSSNFSIYDPIPTCSSANSFVYPRI